MSQKFLAIDFETANYESDSACSVGLVRVESGQIVSTDHYFIQPPYKNFVFTYVHGITWRDVAKAPLFSEVWSQIQPLFEGIDFIAAHNASFDQKVLNSCCLRYRIKPPALPYTCTVKLARKNLGISPANLPSVCNALNIPLKHHDAISDALACAKIVMAALPFTPSSEGSTSKVFSLRP